MSWPPAGADPSPARLVARCRTCQEVAYIVARGDDGVCRVHPCGPGPYAAWPEDAWRPPPKQGSGAVIYGPGAQAAKRGFSASGYLGPAGLTPAQRYARPASAPRLRAGADAAAAARRRETSAERWADGRGDLAGGVGGRGPSAGRWADGRRNDMGDAARRREASAERSAGDWPDEMAYGGELQEPLDDGDWYEAHDRAPLVDPEPCSALLRAFAAAVFARFPDEASAFAAFDINGRGVITKSEFHGGARAIHFQGDAASVFWELDTSNRGALGRREFAMLRRWAPQAYAMRPAKARMPPPSKPQGFHQTMPPAGVAVDLVSKDWWQPGPTGTVANQRHWRSQQGTGVAAALDSWGAWRDWLEPDDVSRSYEVHPLERPRFGHAVWDGDAQDRLHAAGGPPRLS